MTLNSKNINMSAEYMSVTYIGSPSFQFLTREGLLNVDRQDSKVFSVFHFIVLLSLFSQIL